MTVSRILSRQSGGNHLSGTPVARRLVRPTREWTGEPPASRRVSPTTTLPVWPCSGWGLPQPAGHPTAGELLPRHFTLTTRRRERLRGRFVSVALSLGSPPLAVSQHPALWSSDFPRPPPMPRRQPRLPGRLASRPPVQYITSLVPCASRHRLGRSDDSIATKWLLLLVIEILACYSSSD